MTRERVALTTDHARDGPARVTSLEALGDLLEALWRYGPEPEGVVVDVDEAALEALPDGWRVERPVDGDVVDLGEVHGEAGP